MLADAQQVTSQSNPSQAPRPQGPGSQPMVGGVGAGGMMSSGGPMNMPGPGGQTPHGSFVPGTHHSGGDTPLHCIHLQVTTILGWRDTITTCSEEELQLNRTSRGPSPTSRGPPPTSEVRVRCPIDNCMSDSSRLVLVNKQKHFNGS